MRHCGSGFFLTLSTIFLLALTGCLGKTSRNSGNVGVQTVTLSPSSNLSIDVGTTQFFSASAKDSLGRAILGIDIRLIIGVPDGSTGPAPLSINGAGNACAGSWDASGAICNPGASGVATVTAVTSGVSSPPTTVYVHQHVDNIQITRLDPQGPPQHDCFSQGETWNFQATAFSNNLDVTNTVGPVNWTFSNSGVLIPNPLTVGQPPNQLLNQVQTTAKTPGVTQLFANVAGATSSPLPYTTCLVRYIRLQIGGQSSSGSSITVNNGGSVPVTATAVDSVGAVVNAPPLTWSTTNPEVAGFTSTTNTSASNSATARANLGGAVLTASCTPPSCNIGVVPGLPVYASNGLLPNGTNGFGAISVDVTTTTKAPTYTAWAATTGCQGVAGCNSALFAVTSGTTPITSIVNLPRTPNSLVFNHASSGRVYIGSNQGLMFVDVSSASPSVAEVSNSPTPCNVSLCGTVLTVSNDGKLAVVADTVSNPSQVYIYNAGSTTATSADLVIPGETPTAAAFSPDELKLFILTKTGRLYVYSTVDALSSVALATTATDVKFSADGSFAYVAGDPASAISEYSTCALGGLPTGKLGTSATSATPLAIFPSDNVQANGPPLVPSTPASPNSGQPSLVQDIIALEPPNIEVLTAQFTQQPAAITNTNDSKMTCDPPVIANPLQSKGLFNLGQGDFVPLYAQLVADGSEVVLVAQKIPAVLLFSVSNGTTSSVPLVGSADPLAAAASTDGSQVFVAACDQYDQTTTPPTCAVGSIHIINTVSQGDIQQVPYVNGSNRNMCSNSGNPAPQCLPNLIAIRPQ